MFVVFVCECVLSVWFEYMFVYMCDCVCVCECECV